MRWPNHVRPSLGCHTAQPDLSVCLAYITRGVPWFLAPSTSNKLVVAHCFIRGFRTQHVDGSRAIVALAATPLMLHLAERTIYARRALPVFVFVFCVVG